MSVQSEIASSIGKEVLGGLKRSEFLNKLEQTLIGPMRHAIPGDLVKSILSKAEKEIPEGTRIQKSDGMGHIPGDESKSITKMIPISQLEKYKVVDRLKGKHANDYDLKTINKIADELKNGNVIREPLILDHYMKNNWGNLTEGHHRLEAAKISGQSHLPVTIWSKDYESPFKKQGLGSELTLLNQNQWDPHKTGNYLNRLHPNWFYELAGLTDDDLKALDDYIKGLRQ